MHMPDITQWRSVATDPPCEVGEYAFVLGCITGASAPVVYVADRTLGGEVRWMHWNAATSGWEQWHSISEGPPTLWMPCPIPPQREAMQ